jgi:HK97 family phage major capsid protein
MELAEVKKQLDAISEKVKEHGEKAVAEAKKGIDMATSTKEQVDELLTKQTDLSKQVLELQQKLDAGLKQEQTRRQSAGEQVVNTESYKAMQQKGFGRNDKLTIEFDRKDITSLAASAGDLIAPDRRPGILTLPDRRMTVRDLISPGTTDSNLIQYVVETGFTNAAAVVAEGAAKPKSDLTFDLVQKAVTKIATYVKASTEILQDASMLRTFIDYRLRYMLAYVEEQQLLNGSGVGNNLHGIYTQATEYAAPIAIAGATRIDVLRLAILQTSVAQFPATGIVLNEIDWAAIELLKDADGRYIIGNPQGTIAPTLWGLPVVNTPAMAVDTFLVGAFRLGAQIFDRIRAAITVATENEDDFIKNMVTILIEERLGLAVYRPEAFVKGDLTPI